MDIHKTLKTMNQN